MGKWYLGLLLVVLLFMTLGSYEVSADEGGSKGEKEKKQEQLEKTKKAVKKTEKEIIKVLDELEGISKKTEKLEEEELVLRKELQGIQEDIRKVNDEIIGREYVIEKRNGILMERIKSLQEYGGTMSYLEVLLGSTSFVDFIGTANSVKMIKEADTKILEDQQEDLKKVEEDKQVIVTQLEELGKKRIVLENKIQEGNDNAEKKKGLIKELEEIKDKQESEGKTLAKEIKDIIIKEAKAEKKRVGSTVCILGGGMDKKEYSKVFKEAGILTGKGKLIKEVAEDNELDPVLMASIILHETGYGTSNAIKVYNNPGGMMSPKSNWSELIRYSTLEEGLQSMAETIVRITKRENRVTLESIGSVYAPIGADNDPYGLNDFWVKNVGDLVIQMGGEVECVK